MASIENLLISMDDVDDFLVESTFESPKQSLPECPEPVVSRSPQQSTGKSPIQSLSECLESVTSGSPKQSTCKSPVQSSSECLEPVTSGSIKQSTSGSHTQSTPGSPEPLTSKSAKQFTSGSPEQSSSENSKQSTGKSPIQSTGKSPIQSLSECLEPVTSGSPIQSTCKSSVQSSSECLEPVTSGSIKQSTPGSHTQSTPGSPEPLTSKNAKQSTPGSPEQSSSECLKQSSSGSIKQSTSVSHTESTPGSPEPLTSKSAKQSTSGSPEQSSSECPEPVMSGSPEQSSSEGLEQSSSECPEPVASGSIKHSISGNPKQYRSSRRKQFLPGSFKLYESESPEQSMSGSPEHYTSGSSEQYLSSECLELETFESVKHPMSRKPKQYRSSRRKQILPGIFKQYKSESPEQSSFECSRPVLTSVPDQSGSVNKHSTYGKPKQYRSSRRKQILPGSCKQYESESPEQSTSGSLKQSTLGSPKPIKCESSDQYMVECCVPSTSSAHTNSIEWVVGYFKKENVYSVIPSNWLLHENGCWFSKWPNSSYKSTIEARIINASEPAKTWKYYAVQIIKRYDTYDEAEKETFLCLPSNDQNNFGRGKRIKLSSTRQTDFIEDDSDNVDEKPVNLLNSSLVVNRDRKNSKTPIKSIKKELVESVPDTYTNIFECINRLNERLDTLDKLLNGGRSSEMQQNDFDQSFLSLFPMQEVKDIVSIDSRIENCSVFQEKFMCFIVSFSCTGLKDFIKQILTRLFTNNLATNCTWFGFKGKFELKNLKMLKMMNDVSSTSITGHTDAVFQLFVKEWFKHAKKRFNRELNRKSRVITSE